MRKDKWPLPGAYAPRPVLEWEDRVLGSDQFGTWLFCAEGDVHHSADGGQKVLPSDGVQLLPEAGWWVAFWWCAESWIGVDICTPPVLDGSGWSYIDLELDLARLADGSVLLVDEDEFEQTVIACRLPGDVVTAARMTAKDLQARLTTPSEPVVAAGWDWLNRA